ncbi:MAG: tyrosine-type recombinase/integrase [Armatimonadetes bacterium]|nr:tyrosine-type recombinase/integrase [Armatimonadota bacterium]
MSGNVVALVSAARAESTKRAYRSDWAHFDAWCSDVGRASLPASPATVAEYVAHMAGSFKPSTIDRRLAAISVVHRSKGRESPCASELVRSTVAGAKRTHGTARDRKTAVRVDTVRAALSRLDDSIRSKRNRAILLLGYAGAFRRSELVSLDVADLGEIDGGISVTLRRSKGDQEGEGMVKGILFGRRAETCPVRALRGWLESAGITEGAIFRPVTKGGAVTRARLSGRAVAVVVKELAALGGLDPADVSGHSLRAGLITDAFASGLSETEIMAHTGHRSRAVLSVYHRDADLDNSVSGKVGL